MPTKPSLLTYKDKTETYKVKSAMARQTLHKGSELKLAKLELKPTEAKLKVMMVMFLSFQR